MGAACQSDGRTMIGTHLGGAIFMHLKGLFHFYVEAVIGADEVSADETGMRSACLRFWSICVFLLPRPDASIMPGLDQSLPLQQEMLV